MLGEVILATILNKLVDQIENRVINEIAPEIQSIEGYLVQFMEGIDNIESNLERLLAISLKSAFTFIRLNEFEKALDKLVEADASDDRSALAKFWLSIILFRNGILSCDEKKKKEAIMILEEALELNPFIIYVAGAPSILNQNLLQSSSDRVQTFISWKTSINSAMDIKKRPNRDDKFLNKIFGNDRHFCWASFEAVSVSGGHPVISWISGPTCSSSRKYRLVSVLDLSTGDFLWSYDLNSHQELCLATPRFVILKCSKPTQHFKFLDILTGRVNSTMKNEYFKTVFCPNLSQLKQLEFFQKSNCRMGEIPMDHNSERIGSVTTFKGYKERILTDPHGLNAYIIRVMNEEETIVGGRTRSNLLPFFEEKASFFSSAVIQREL